MKRTSAAAGQQPEADRADAAVELRDARPRWHERLDPLHGPIEKGQVVLAEGRGREEHVDPGDPLAHRGLAEEWNRRRSEYGVAARRLGIEEETLQATFEALRERGGQLAQDRRRLAAADQYDLDALARALDHDLHITQRAAVGGVVVGDGAGLADRLAQGVGGLVDPRMMNGAVGRRDDPVAAGLEEADLRVRGAAPDRQACAVAMAEGRAVMDAGLGERSLHGELA